VCKVVPTLNGGRLAGFFECHECGMTYWRVGPDKGLADRMRRDRIPVYGSVWDQALTLLWSDHSVSLRSLCRALGVDSLTARRQASRLGLPAFRHGHRSSNELVPVSGISCPAKSDIDDRKSQWLALRAESPNASRTALRDASNAAYTFLRRHAPEWLELNSPTPQPRRSDLIRVDWPARDAQIALEVRAAAGTLAAIRPPLRLTRTAILREADHLWIAPEKLSKLPRTDTLLNHLAEGRVSFAIRRIQHTVAEIALNDESAERWKIIRSAGLRSEMLENPKVAKALEEAVETLSTQGFDPRPISAGKVKYPDLIPQSSSCPESQKSEGPTLDSSLCSYS
jgi:Tn7-like transposition protein D